MIHAYRYSAENESVMFGLGKDSRNGNGKSQKKQPQLLRGSLPLPFRGADDTRRPLTDITNNPRHKEVIQNTSRRAVCSAKDSKSRLEVELFPDLIDLHMKTPSGTLEKSHERIEDPHFVLGISTNATEDE